MGPQPWCQGTGAPGVHERPGFDGPGVQPATLPPGTVIAGAYRVSDPIAVGGHTVVYAAEGTDDGRPRAIKVLHLERGAPVDALERFQREARLTARAVHGNIVEMHAVGALRDGSPYLVMERLDGIDLDRRLDRGGLSIPAVVELGRQLCTALAVLADTGIVHRDIKPHNLVLHRDARRRTVVKLVDFGIATERVRTASDGALTSDGMIVGTPPYMAPEQILNRPLDPRADLYAASVVLYEALTGLLPIDPSTTDPLMAPFLRESVAPPRRWRANCPGALGRIVLKGLSRDPNRRYAHPRDMRTALAQAADALGLPQGEAAWSAPDLQRAPLDHALLRLRALA
jgi:eukaryotic-like serine/threonine-protein kinase